MLLMVILNKGVRSWVAGVSFAVLKKCERYTGWIGTKPRKVSKRGEQFYGGVRKRKKRLDQIGQHDCSLTVAKSNNSMQGCQDSLSPVQQHQPPLCRSAVALTTMLTFYAELLTNIRAITLSVHLSSPASASTRITVDPSASVAILHHHGESIRLPLPAEVNSEPQQCQYRAIAGTENLSCRLELALPLRPRGENHTRWSAPELIRIASVSFDCHECGSTLIPRERIKKWKDLPSGNWADMMDLWHCHKPLDDDKKKREAGGDESAKYSAFGKGFAVERGTGLVDRVYLLLPTDDCENIQVS